MEGVSVFSLEGVHVAVANNGLQVVDMVGRKSYDTAFKDNRMRELNGYQAARRTGETEALLERPMSAMTTHAVEGDEENCLDAEMSVYFTKPIKRKHLSEVLGKSVGPRAPGEQVGRRASDKARTAIPAGLEVNRPRDRLRGIVCRSLVGAGHLHTNICSNRREGI